MADNWILSQEIDLRRGIQAPQVWPDALIVCGDNKAHTWRVTIMDDGKPAALSGTVTGYFIRGDNATVTVGGELTGNVATVTLAQSCYNVEGDMAAVMRLKTSAGLITLAALILPVRRMITDTIVDPENIIPSLEDLLEQIERIEASIKAADTATGKANTAASNADAKAAAADAAASAANTAASNADVKAAAADAAAGAANTAASNADAQAAAANTGAILANEKANAAQSAAILANEKASAAQSAADAASTATTAANTAAENANEKAAAANAAAGNASTAATEANAAAGKLNGLTVSATALDTGQPPTAALREEGDHYHLALGLPHGLTGATPQISVQVSTGAPGSEATVSVTGTAEAPVLHLTIPRGDTGDIGSLTINGKVPDASGAVTLGMDDISGLSEAITNAGGVKTVAGVEPDASGNVPLNAGNVGARPATWTPTAAEVGAYPASGIRTLAISIAVSAWTGSGPYTATISSEGVTGKTDCRFELGSTVTNLVADISWETAAGTITLTTASKPTGTIAGTVVLTEVSV